MTAVPPAVLPEPPEFPSPTIVDSRRLMGPNLFSTHEGALLDVICEGARGGALIAEWQSQSARLADGLGWPEPSCVVRRTTEGAGLFLSAPLDGLMTATEVNEQAWVAAEAVLAGIAPASATVGTLRAKAALERRTRPHMVAVAQAAAARGLTVTFDDETLSVGSGAGSRTWPLASLPTANGMPWSTLSDVPRVLVTGSNGKTTTTRLLAAMWRTAGVAAGWCCTDGVLIDGHEIVAGDYSGPAGARAVLRDPRVQAAVIETARGGILRRGLAMHQVTAAIITNISADHFGEYGIESLQELAEAKGVVASVVGPTGRLVLNADDATLVEWAERCESPVAWFSVEAANPRVLAHVAHGGDAAIIRDGGLWIHWAGVWHELGEVNAMPLTQHGLAPHNVANALGAALLGAATGVPIAAMQETLARFGASRADNPGRLQLYRFGGVTAFVDYAHNPDGIAALCRTAASMPATRRLLILGQAGNRPDESLRDLARSAWAITPFDRVILKDIPRMLRGRQPGDVSRILGEALLEAGTGSDQIETAPSEFDAVQRAFAWARDGDLLLLPVHAERELVLPWLARLLETEWRAGMPLLSLA